METLKKLNCKSLGFIKTVSTQSLQAKRAQCFVRAFMPLCGNMETLKKLNCKGQAAMTDALFFLLIVSALCALLFLFSSQYGMMVSDEVKRSYGSDYATSALKTILYGSVPRNLKEKLADAKEVDYLLAAVKEDYAYVKPPDNKQRLDANVQKILHQNISAIMQPIAEQFDYMFYIYRTDAPSDADEFAYLLLHMSICKSALAEDELCPEEDAGHIDYICAPEGPGGTAAFSLTVDELLITIPNSAQSVSNVWLSKVEAGGGSEPTRVPARSVLIMWPAVYLQTEIPAIFAGPQQPWYCCDASREECPAP